MRIVEWTGLARLMMKVERKFEMRTNEVKKCLVRIEDGVHLKSMAADAKRSHLRMVSISKLAWSRT